MDVNGQGAVSDGTRWSEGRGYPDRAFWDGRRVLLTGHTGFKGAWLALWLQMLGAHVTGFALGIPTQPSLYELARVGDGLTHVEGDIRNFAALSAAVAATAPEIIIHMAAQSLVRRSFSSPRATYEVNVLGTVNLLDAVRCHGAVRAMINVTSDKCYENREWEWGYREHEPMGGDDPYSSSKGCSELVTSAYRRSFFAADESPRLASVRAGNVIGGGDWSENRLVPDLMRAALAEQVAHVRNPHSVRPWQHVLNPLSGYLALVEALWSSSRFASSWNFGPCDEDAQSVRAIARTLTTMWPARLRWADEGASEDGAEIREAAYLRVDSSRARAQLGWRPRWGLRQGLENVVAWYRAFDAGEDMGEFTRAQIESFEDSVAETVGTSR